MPYVAPTRIYTLHTEIFPRSAMDRARKRELRSLNTRAWDGETDLFAVSKSLDSSLKKNTAFIKRLRTAISAATLNTFLQEIRALSLHKYLSEIVSACYEGLCKLKSPGEIEAGVEIVSALHQRFGPSEFTEYLGWLLGKGMATPDKSLLKSLAPEVREKEEKERLTRQRVLLRVVTELWLVDVLRTLDDVTRPDDATKGATGKVPELKLKAHSNKSGAAEPFPLEVLKDLLGHDREHVNLPLLVIFVKAFSWDVLGVKPTTGEGRKTVEEDGATKITNGAAQGEGTEDAIDVDDHPFTPPELQEKFKNILKKYFEDVKSHVLRDQKSIHSQARRNAEAYVKSGEVFEDRQSNFEKQVKSQERLVANAQAIADAIGSDMPDLKDNDDTLAASNGSIGLVKAGDYLRGLGDGAGIWEDEDERRYYENLVDLKGKVPGILLDDGKKKKPDNEEQVGRKADPTDAPEAPKVPDSSDDQSTAIANKTIGAQVDAVLARLPDLTNKDVIDQAAIDFCYLNSKASRNRLIKALTEVPKGRGDLLPSWARLAATLGRYMPDIPKGLVEYLDAEFRSLQRRKDKDFLGQVRLSNIRYLAELTKFGIVPEHVVFHCLKVSLDDFSRMNIEIICNLLENCGRYLLRNPETSPRMATFLETLQRKKSVQHIGQAERMLIENAVYYVDPPDRPAIQQKERTPMEQFIRKLIYMDMTKRNYSKILKQIRRLHWEEAEVVRILEKVFSKPGKVKFGNIHLLAILLSALYRYHPAFVVKAIDNVMDSIAFGLEQNDFKFYQRRISEVKYIGELYNYRMVEHPVIFDAMYKIMTFGHGGVPVHGRLNPFDLPDDFFRIRLIATILETCGMYFAKGVAGKKLDYFLSFFQYYIYTKQPLPMDIEFIVQDTFALTRPQWKLASNLEEASKAFQLAIAQDQKVSGADKVVETDDASIGSSTDDEDGDADLPEAEADEEESDSEDEGEDHELDLSHGDSESEDEAIVVTRQQEQIDPEAEAEFDREYAKMMAESLESRKFERKPLFDVPLPVRGKSKETTSGPDSGETAAPAPSSTMAFSLLTKKGNRQQTRTVELPSDSTFAVAMKNQQQAEREEQQRIKNLVLNYDLRENEDQDGNHSAKLLQSNPNIHNSGAGHEKPTSYHHNRSDRGKDRSGQRVRKLQLSDVDWYESSTKRGGSFARTRSSCSQAMANEDEREQLIAAPVHHGIVDKRGKPIADYKSRPTARMEQFRKVRPKQE
ncbi:MIF4G domain-containing protein [Colletotrichum karsti]|uniref:MIF4G domain-containing protein n=1 Tax=Colletotrichum karsti TaxID=1095194 RepID=A0A9P6LQ92_9PEZI|nr:MIF4G domain-containing protein [Colletotrichum karsti]KAF9881371.1 MIF4G domain-containing protein [Colletotrichum karsti]